MRYLELFDYPTLGQAYAYLEGDDSERVRECPLSISEYSIRLASGERVEDEETNEEEETGGVYLTNNELTKEEKEFLLGTLREEQEWLKWLASVADGLEWSSAIKKATKKTTATDAPVLARGQYGHGLRRTVVITVRDGAKRRENGHYDSSSSSWKETTKRVAQFARHKPCAKKPRLSIRYQE